MIHAGANLNCLTKDGSNIITMLYTLKKYQYVPEQYFQELAKYLVGSGLQLTNLRKRELKAIVSAVVDIEFDNQMLWMKLDRHRAQIKQRSKIGHIQKSVFREWMKYNSD